MTKPIFILKLSDATISEIVKAKENKKHLADNYILVVNTNHDELTFKVVYEIGFDETKFNELKKIIKNELL